MTSTEYSISLKDVIEAISTQQAVLNLDELMALNKPNVFTGVNNLELATQSQISFLVDARYADRLSTTQAGAVFTSRQYIDSVPSSSVPILVNSPYLAYAAVSGLFDINSHKPPSIHATAQVAHTAVLGVNVFVGAYSVIGDNVKIGAATQIHAHTVIEDNVNIGKQCFIYPHVSIAHRCKIGDKVRIHSHASIGSEGFGFAPTQDPAQTGWQRIVQLGSVVIGNNVRIGSQTCIDRGAINDTIIEDNVIIDNLVQIAHNVHIGAGTAIAAMTGIAGSTSIGKRCIIGGAVGIVGHIVITDDVTLTSMTMVTKSIKKSGSYSSGTTAMPSMDWRRAVVRFRNMGIKSVK